MPSNGPAPDADAPDAAHVFGYGSLVNRGTHDYPAAVPARVAGWRRVWRCLEHHATAFLSVEPADGWAIDGLLATVPATSWAALDAREAGYDRLAVEGRVLEGAQGRADVRIYAIPQDRPDCPDRPILMSYLDTVVQGFLLEYGEDGVARFFDTTANWAVGIVDDRAAPRYGRTQATTAEERALVDRHLARLGVVPDQPG